MKWLKPNFISYLLSSKSYKLRSYGKWVLFFIIFIFLKGRQNIMKRIIIINCKQSTSLMFLQSKGTDSVLYHLYHSDMCFIYLFHHKIKFPNFINLGLLKQIHCVICRCCYYVKAIMTCNVSTYLVKVGSEQIVFFDLKNDEFCLQKC